MGTRTVGLGVVLAACLAGCTLHQTPDGHSLWSGSGQGSVRSRLGEPDLIAEHTRYGFGGSNLQTDLYYLDRGYEVWFLDNRVRGVQMLSAAERPDLERRARAYREELHKVKVGDGQAGVLARLGPPEHVSSGTIMAGGGEFQDYSGPYRGQLEASPAVEWARCAWRERYLLVDFRDGVVVETRTLTAWYLEHGMGEKPPVKP